VPAPCQFTICRDRQSSRKREQHGVLVSPALRRFSPARSSPGGRDSRITAEPRSPCDGNHGDDCQYDRAHVFLLEGGHQVSLSRLPKGFYDRRIRDKKARVNKCGAHRNLCAVRYLSSLLNGEVGPMDRDFKNEVFSSYEPNPAPPCGTCGAKPAQVLKMLNPQSGKTVRMFKCPCGEQTWKEN